MVRTSSLVLGVLALALTGCPSNVGPGPATGSTAPSVADGSSSADAARSPEPSGSAEPTGRLRVAGCEPGSLWPSDAAGCAAPVVRLLYAPLVAWDGDGTPIWGDDAPHALLAHVRSEDQRTWTLELKADRTHHDGTSVTADDIARGWRDAAFGPNARAFAHLLRDVVGFDDLRCGPTSACATAPLPPDLAGVEVVDESTLEVDLAQPDSQFPVRLGHRALSPLPPQAEEDPEAFGEQPIGTGPMRMDGPWRHDERIVLSRVETSDGPSSSAEEVTVTGVEFVLLRDHASRMAGLRDARLDVVPGARPFDPVLADGGEVTGAGLGYTFLAWPGGPPDTRLADALALALDRDEVVDRVLASLARPAGTVVPTHLAGADPASCADACGHDPAQASELVEAAGGVPGDQLTILVPGGLPPPELEAVEAVARQWEEVLPPLAVDVEEVPVADLPDRIAVAAPNELARLSWSADLPAPRAYLQPLHTADGAFAFDGFDDPTVRTAIETGDVAPTSSAAAQAYAEAEAAVAATGHHVPLWFETVRVLHGPRVADLPLDPQGIPRYEDATLASVE